MTYLLYDEPPLCISPTLAMRIGLNEAILLQQVHYWLKIAEQGKQARNFREGRWWVYNTLTEWHAQFPFWSLMTLRRTLESLEARGILESASLTEDRRIRTKWYTVDYRALERSAEGGEQTESAKLLSKSAASNGTKRNCSKRTNAIVQNEQITSVQNEQMQSFKMNSCIGTENTTENTQRETLNVQEKVNFVSPPEYPTQAKKSNLRTTVLDKLTTALVNELGDRGSEKRHRQLLDICERHGLDELAKKALLATRRRLAQEQEQGVLEKPGAYYQKILLGFLEDHQVFVPPVGSQDEQDQARKLVRESLNSTDTRP